jgi:NAD(P)H-binding
MIEGNAKDIAFVSQCLRCDGKLVDEIIFTIGGKLNFPRLTLDDPGVCRTGIATVLEAITQLRAGGIDGHPYIVACSTAGISDFGRDLPLVMVPLFYYVLKAPNEDKKAMEKRLEESIEDYTVVRMSALMSGETKRIIRVGLEDPKKGREEAVIGYTISKEDAGRWIVENLVLVRDAKYLRKIVLITY